MLFTKESDYAIRIVRALKNEEKLTIKDICEKESLPEAFAYKIIKKLSKNGIVDIKRGANGGYNLRKKLDMLTLYDIVVSTEPDFAVMDCINNFCGRNGHSGRCRVHKELVSIQKEVESLLKRKTLKDILESESK
ncbi:RrF2 family transcriptional regulator [Peptacetobacter sp.]|uniref:RrF2 family transcriptional regulator n=1 Tax=Peptacetobacter sp. TaxID=2991975 RepID=UPI00262F6EF9|nr:Rrf2 family transcriptional regulator [Peptacetobacter sp.]